MGAQSPRVSVLRQMKWYKFKSLKKLEDAGIACSISNKYLNSILSTPTATALKLEVNIHDEQKHLKLLMLICNQKIIDILGISSSG